VIERICNRQSHHAAEGAALFRPTVSTVSIPRVSGLDHKAKTPGACCNRGLLRLTANLPCG
jgi:hypothetical protein